MCEQGWLPESEEEKGRNDRYNHGGRVRDDKGKDLENAPVRIRNLEKRKRPCLGGRIKMEEIWGSLKEEVRGH